MPAITESVRRFARRFHRPVRCSACGQPRGAGRRVIAGPSVYICESCIATPARPGASPPPQARCSFCGRHDVPTAAAWPSLAICRKCVELSHSILVEDDRRSRPAT